MEGVRGDSLVDIFAIGIEFLPDFGDGIVSKLEGTQSALLRTVAMTYRHWRNEITNGMARDQTLGKRVSNAVAEGNNNKLKSLKNLSNGLTNFARLGRGRC